VHGWDASPLSRWNQPIACKTPRARPAMTA